jgi:putative PIN family toxin of toxin-antitoxin system
MTGVTLDANALVAGVTGLRNIESTPGALVRAWRDGRFDLILSNHILHEVRRTLGSPYFRARLSPEDVNQFMDMLAADATIVALTMTVTGPEDDLVPATALSGSAEYLVTGDCQLLRLTAY